MTHILSKLIYVIVFTTINTSIIAQHYDCVVAQDGTGNYSTINEAINSISSENFCRKTILIKKGTYNEKVRIDQNNISLIGEDKERTIIKSKQLKKEWLKNRDYFGPAILNINGNDIIIKNLTIQNTSQDIGPNAYVVYGKGTRTIIQNCYLLGNGANSISLMNYEEGMYFLDSCRIEGTVDFMRAMGWCYISNSSFYQKEAISSLWHAGITDRNQKMVIINSQFDGEEHYFLGRHHYDAQFYLINCNFTERLADKPIYKKEYPKKPENEKANIFGNRYYYYNCKKENGNYSWLDNNFKASGLNIKPEEMSSSWTFDNRWQPETPATPKLINIRNNGLEYIFEFDQSMTAIEKPIIKTIEGDTLTFIKGNGRNSLMFICTKEISKHYRKHSFTIVSGKLISTQAQIHEVALPTTFQIDKK